MLKTNLLKISILAVFLGIFLTTESCRKDTVFNTDPNFRLEFSTDTVKFDTIFTTLGSTTLWLKVYNRSDKDVDIQSIELLGGDASSFRINVDGDTTLLLKNVRLRAKDSLFIFIRATINPNDEIAPFEVLDYIRFSFNNRSQSVVIRAFGQNAHYHFEIDGYLEIPSDDGGTIRIPYTLADCSQPWQSGKSHVIYNYLYVKSGDVLTLEAGVRLHFAPDAGLFVAEGASLKIRGNLGQEVILEGMRMDEEYRHTPGQWGRVWLSAGSVDNEINWAIIRNGKIGLWVDSVSNPNPTLTIENTIIDNMQNHGIWAQSAEIHGSNLQVSNCGERLLALSLGGSYRFEHCTFANYFSWSSSYRRTASVLLSNYEEYFSAGQTSTSFHPLERADFTSCIIYGTLQDELEVNLSSQVAGNYDFSYCNIRTRISTLNRPFYNCEINVSPYFKGSADGDFDVYLPSSSSSSGVIAKGKPSPNIIRDLKGRGRAYFPTIGAYEFTEE